MADNEKWGLSREEIDRRLRELNQKKKATGPTRGGHSSGQGVKLLFIRDYLYQHATKEHPKNAKASQEYLSKHQIKADATFTIPPSRLTAIHLPLHTGPAGPYRAQPGKVRLLARRKGGFPSSNCIPLH